MSGLMQPGNTYTLVRGGTRGWRILNGSPEHDVEIPHDAKELVFFFPKEVKTTFGIKARGAKKLALYQAVPHDHLRVLLDGPGGRAPLLECVASSGTRVRLTRTRRACV